MPLFSTALRDHTLRFAKAAAIILALSRSDLSSGAQHRNPVIGDWKFVAVLDSVDVTMLSEEDAQRLLGHVMSIREGGALLDNYKCGKPDFETLRVEPNLYLEKEGGIDNSKLRLPNPVTVIDISCAMVFMKKPDRAVITWRGWFFEATKVKRNLP